VPSTPRWRVPENSPTTPQRSESDVDSERLVILEELAMDDDSPDDVAHRMFASQLFADHPLGRETAGDRDTVQAINAAEVFAKARRIAQ